MTESVAEGLWEDTERWGKRRRKHGSVVDDKRPREVQVYSGDDRDDTVARQPSKDRREPRMRAVE